MPDEKVYKKLSELSPEQMVQIATLALEGVMTLDWIREYLHNREIEGENFRLNVELWEPKEKLAVYRIYLHGAGDTYCALWEVDNENRIDITVVDDHDTADVSNQVQIVKKLIEWGFV